MKIKNEELRKQEVTPSCKNNNAGLPINPGIEQ